MREEKKKKSWLRVQVEADWIPATAPKEPVFMGSLIFPLKNNLIRAQREIKS